MTDTNNSNMSNVEHVAVDSAAVRAAATESPDMKMSSEKNSAAKPVLGARAEFYLIYLLFYFVPWLFQRPETIDVVVAFAALIIFVPFYLYFFKRAQVGMSWHTTALSILCFALSYATAPFFGSHGTYFIYAIVVAAFIRPRRSAYTFMAVLVILYLPITLLSDEPWFWTAFTIVLGLMIGIGTTATAAQEDREASLTRSRDLDSHLAALGERERIARDLHDLLGHTLTMVALKAELAEKLIDSDPVRSRQELTELRDVSRRALKNVRDAISGMHMTSLPQELDRAKEAMATAGVDFAITGSPPQFNEDTSQTLGLVIREAITNIVRHSLASEARIAFTQSSMGVQIKIGDNGTGEVSLSGNGLRGIQRRVEALDGELTITTTGGTTLTIELPNDVVALAGEA